MCTAVYIAAEAPLPLVSWREASPAFYVEELEAEADVVRQYFNGRSVYSVGSYQGCSCGLAYQPYEGGDEQEAERTRHDWDLFARYLEDSLQHVSVVELFTCWEGDQHEPPDDRVVIAPADIREGRFEYNEGTYALIRRST